MTIGAVSSLLKLRVSEIRQAYLAISERVSIRVRIKNGERAFLTIKSASPGPSRSVGAREVLVVDSLPRLATGKVTRRDLAV